MPVNLIENDLQPRLHQPKRFLQGFLAGRGQRFLWLWIAVLVLLGPLPAQATVLCRDVAGHQVCILHITRSAKHHWEYRAVVSVDGKKRPQAVYDCRNREKSRRERQPADLAGDEAGTLICSYFQARR